MRPRRRDPRAAPEAARPPAAGRLRAALDIVSRFVRPSKFLTLEAAADKNLFGDLSPQLDATYYKQRVLTVPAAHPAVLHAGLRSAAAAKRASARDAPPKAPREARTPSTFAGVNPRTPRAALAPCAPLLSAG